MAAHKLGLARLAFLGVLGIASQAEAASMTLAWDHTSASNVTGYQVAYGTQSGKYTTTIRVGYVTSISVTGLAEGTTYYFVVHSYDSSGVVGAPSSEVAGQTVTTALPALTISCPSPVLTSLDGKSIAVTITPTVSGGVTPVMTTCSPASGSLFPVGTTSFTCTATDSASQRASCSSTVVVLPPPEPASQPAPQPSLPPLAITCPTIAPVTANGNSGKAVVKFANPTVGGGKAPVSTSCTPSSGSQFNLGTTTVSCHAIDAAQQRAACTTTATVLAPTKPGK